MAGTITLFMPLVSFYTSRKPQKTRDFFMFSGVIEKTSDMKGVKEKLTHSCSE